MHTKYGGKECKNEQEKKKIKKIMKNIECFAAVNNQ